MSADRPNEPRTRREVHRTDVPTLSVVVTSRGDAGALRARLAELLPLCGPAGVEVLVVLGGPPDEARALAREHPAVHFLRPAEDAAPESLRSIGMEAASGDVVMLTRDDDPAAVARLHHLLRAHGVLGAAGDSGPERPPAAEQGRQSDRPAGRPDSPPTEAAGDGTWQPRSSLAGAWTGSPRATGSSSSAPAPAA